MTRVPAGGVRRAVEAWLAGYAPAASVTVAVSGGPDSLALALAVADLGRAGRSITVDHGLQDGSAEQAAAAAALVGDLGFDARVIRVAVTGPGGMEAAARRARYAALAEHADGPVLLGHTMDDQAETVLLGLGRGSGPRSIAGMRPWTPPWGRPLLGVRRSDTLAACAGAGLTAWDDPHNADPAFTRVRLRREVLPLLDQVLGGGVVPALARTAELLADDLAGAGCRGAGRVERGRRGRRGAHLGAATPAGRGASSSSAILGRRHRGRPADQRAPASTRRAGHGRPVRRRGAAAGSRRCRARRRPAGGSSGRSTRVIRCAGAVAGSGK